MRNRCVVCFFILTIMVGCSKLDRTKEKSLDLKKYDSIDIVGENISALKHYNPVALKLFGDNLIFRTSINSYLEYFHVYKYPEIYYANSFGRQGNGPNEFYEGSFTYYNQNNDSLWFVDMNHKKFKYIEIKTGNIIKSIIFPKAIGMPENVSIINERYILGTCISDFKGSFFLYDSFEKKIQRNNLIPKIDLRGINSAKKSVIYKSTVKTNNDFSKIVIAYMFFGQIDIFDNNLNRLISIKINHNNVNAKWDYLEDYEAPKDAWQYFVDVQVTNNCIYALFNNWQLKDIDNKHNLSSVVLKFNWDGELLSKYTLNNMISKFIIDEERSIFLGLNIDSERPFSLYKVSD